MMLFLPLLTALALAQPTAPEASRVRMVWPGAHGGIGSGQVRFDLLDRVREAQALPVASVRPVHGWMVRGRWAIAADDRTLASTLKLFAGGELVCEPPEPATRLQSANESLVLAGDHARLGAPLRVRTADTGIRQCVSGGISARVIGPTEGPLPSLELERFETRLALTWTLEDGRLADSLGRPDSEGTRRFATLRSARAQSDVFVDAGRFVDGASSVRDGALSLHRATAFEFLRTMEPAALAPGDTELAGGPAALLQEAGDLPWTAANWAADDEARRLPPSRTHTTQEGLTLAFIGVIDPAIAEQDTRFQRDGVSLTDPVAAVHRTVEGLRAAEPPPDLIVVLSSARARTLNRLRRELVDVDLILGDRDEDVRRLASQDITLRSATPGTMAAPAGVTLPLAGIQRADLVIEDGALSRIELQPIPVPITQAPDPKVLARVTKVRAQSYPALEDPLLHPIEPLGTITGPQFAKATCEAVLASTDADLALLPPLPAPPPIPGPLTALLIADRLALPQHVEVHRIPGDLYRTLLDRAFALDLLSCGSPLGQRFPKAKGRPVEDQRIYTVVTTDRLRSGSPLDGLLSQARSSRLLDASDPELIRGEDGQARSLRSVALSSLRSLRDTHAEALLPLLLARSFTDKPPRWDVRARQLSVRIEGFEGVDDEAYSQVPETRATSPSSLTVATTADLALEYSSAGALWDARARSSFTRLRTADGPQETADDLKFSSSVTLPMAAIPLGPLKLQPFSEALFDSEFTPTETEDGTQNPRQADLSLTLGLATPITGWLKAFRVGVLVLQDLAVTSKRAEIGARIEGQTRIVFGPGLSWSNQLDAFYYGDTPDQDASDLRFKVYIQSRVGLPLARWLDLAFFTDAFVFQGRVEQTRAVSGSFTVGAGLDLGGVFSL